MHHTGRHGASSPALAAAHVHGIDLPGAVFAQHTVRKAPWWRRRWAQILSVRVMGRSSWPQLQSAPGSHRGVATGPDGGITQHLRRAGLIHPLARYATNTWPRHDDGLCLLAALRQTTPPSGVRPALKFYCSCTASCRAGDALSVQPRRDDAQPATLPWGIKRSLVPAPAAGSHACRAIFAATRWPTRRSHAVPPAPVGSNT